MKVLYLTYDGLTDPLGQSQILPYLKMLSTKGAEISIISFEKKQRFAEQKKEIDAIVKKAKISWHPLPYTKRPPVLSTIFDLWKLRNKTNKIIQANQIEILHCRSYITSLVALWAKKKFGVKFIFDMRGFFADERVDGKIWNLQNPFYKTIYKFFKKKEKQFFVESETIISLTHAGKREILKMNLNIDSSKITVIPCCADIDFFNPDNYSVNERNIVRGNLNLPENSCLMVYSGGLGTWYCLHEMLLFFQKFQQQKPNTHFLILTTEPAAMVRSICEKINLDIQSITVKKSSRDEMPKYLLAADLALFFILPCFSKLASSPTKQGEMMAMQLPIFCNSGVGDTAEVIEKYDAGWVLNNFENDEMEKSLQQFSLNENKNKQKIRSGAIEFYSLKNGVEKYWSIYQSLSKN